MPLSPDDILVSTDWLARHLDDSDLRILDGSWHLPTENRDARAEFEAQHIPGAQFFDIDAISDTSSPLPHMVPDADQFATQVAELGIGAENSVVVYDNSGVWSAARVRWLLRAMGLTRVAVLDGGLQKWLAEGRATTADTAKPQLATLTAHMDQSRVRDAAEVLQATQDPDIQIVDARAPERFRGEVPEPRAGLRAGHIPGSRNVFFKALLNDDGTLKPDTDLRQVFEQAGVDLEKPVIASCGSGVTASVLCLALEKIGHRDLSVYDGSWTEWGQNEEFPIETGEAD
jgi:thiosulfate/3-mercaptopyruvate sulfurtransferase